MLLAVDMGNTNIEVGLLDEEKTIFSERIATDLGKTSTEYAVLIHTIFEMHNLNPKDVTGAIISSVVPPLTYDFRNAVKTVTGHTALLIAPGIKTGIKLKVEDPRSVGADLIVGAVGAVHKYGKPCIIIDMGTATTMIAVDKDNNFLGGAVIPGVNLSLKALSSGTSQLPSVSLDAPKKVINSQTVEAMQSGIVYGQASLLDGMIDRMNKELGYDCTVVATGGLAKLIVPYCTHEITLDNNLMLDGLRIVYKMNQ